MKSQRTLSTIIILLVGVFIGFAITILIGLIEIYVEGGKPLVGHKTFGDIKIWAKKPEVAGDAEVPEGFYQEDAKELWMTKNDIPFLLITQNAADKISGLYLIKSNYEPILILKPLSTPGKWGRATYSRPSGTGHPVGDAFIDIDFDGRFDFKMVLDNNGKRISRSIFIDGTWQEVDRCSVKEMRADIGQTSFIFVDGAWQKIEYWSADQSKATIGQMKYAFDPNSGWQVSK